jgi:hypothetical protein
MAPAPGRHRTLQHRRPQRTADIVAGGRHADRDPAMAHEPLRHVGPQRSEGRRGADANEQMHQRKLERGRNQRRSANAKRQAAQHNRDYDAEAIAESSHCDTAQGEARHCKRIGQGDFGAGNAEISLHERQSTGIDHMPTLPMVLTATANPSRCQAAGESTSLSWRSKSMELPGSEFMSRPLMARLCRQLCAVSWLQLTNRQVCERLHGVLTAKRLAVFAAAACGRKFLDRVSCTNISAVPTGCR